MLALIRRELKDFFWMPLMGLLLIGGQTIINVFAVISPIGFHSGGHLW